jgi:hypothetical protein
MEIIFSNDPMAKVFLGTQSSQDAELPLHQAVSYGSVMLSSGFSDKRV